jgi:thiol-disulfide isomerase/thioredoxin
MTSTSKMTSKSKMTQTQPVAIILTVAIGLLLAGFLFMWCGGEPPSLGLDPGAHRVTELEGGDVEEFSRKAGACLMFYADWCGHCKQMKPNYIAAAARVGTPCALLNDNQCQGKDGPGATYGIRGYPTLIKFLGAGKFETYRGDRSVESIVAFCG